MAEGEDGAPIGVAAAVVEVEAERRRRGGGGGGGAASGGGGGSGGGDARYIVRARNRANVSEGRRPRRYACFPAVPRVDAPLTCQGAGKGCAPPPSACTRQLLKPIDKARVREKRY